jgi:hypothetical protein
LLGFALTIEAAVVPMITPLSFPLNVLVYLVIAAVTWRLILFSGWFQNKLIAWKNRYEGRVWSPKD